MVQVSRAAPLRSPLRAVSNAERQPRAEAPAVVPARSVRRAAPHEIKRMALVELRNVSKIYHLGGEEIRALDDVSCDFYVGDFISFIGMYGSCYRTLLHTMGCFDSTKKCTIKLEGTLINDVSTIELAPTYPHRY